MNKPRRKQLNKALELLAEARAIIEEMQEQEQECFDNMPEGLQASEQGEKIEENASRLEEIIVRAPIGISLSLICGIF